MKQNSTLTVLAGSCGVFLLSSLAATAQDPGFYIKAGAGGAWTGDLALKEYFGPVAHGSEVKLDPGARFVLGGGYHVTDWFAAELETGVIANTIDSVTDATRVEDATFSNVPFLVNARFQCPERLCPFSPYVGGGFGGAVSVLSAEHLDLGGTKLHGSQSTSVLAYQAFAGLRYAINKHMAASLEYRFFGTSAPEWEADFTVGTKTDNIKFGRAETHSVNLGFEYKF